MVLELEDDSADEVPVYEVGESPERINLISSRPRKNVEPPNIYGEMLYTVVIGEQETGAAVTPSPLMGTLPAITSRKMRRSAENFWSPNQLNSQGPSFHMFRRN